MFVNKRKSLGNNFDFQEHDNETPTQTINMTTNYTLWLHGSLHTKTIPWFEISVLQSRNDV